MAVLYLHIPAPPAPVASDRFVASLERAIGHRVPPAHAADPIIAIYIGGAPLTLTSPQQERLSRALKEALAPDTVQEVTVEAAPNSISLPVVRNLRRLGATRLSLDVRSFATDTLRRIDAPHRRPDIDQALHAVRAAGLRSYTVDLHLGPDAAAETDVAASLQAAVTESVPHIALVEQPGPASAEARADALAHAQQYLARQGYEPYLLTDFARPGHRSRYQTAYYSHANILGLGPGAESFWWQPRTGATPGWRWTNVAEVEQYIRSWEAGRPAFDQREPLDRTARAREYILLRLRTQSGLDLSHLATQYGVDLRSRAANLFARLSDTGRVEQTDGHLRLTRQGRLLADAITQRVLRSL